MLPLLTLGLVLYFDGSLRPPRDAGFPTQALGRMASCGAALYTADNTLLAIGGKSLDIIPDITSADVEYDGLLFGLNKCLDECRWKQQDDAPIVVVHVRGDCKAIIDQLNGIAVPRKLLPKHERALNMIERARFSVSFEHVIRDENVLCDSICAGVMNILEQRQVTTFREKLAFISQSTSTVDASQRDLLDLLKESITSEKSLVRYSIRPKLYLEATEVARRLNDGMAIEHIGRQLADEARLCQTDGSIRKELMTAVGISWQVEGLNLVGNEKQAKRLLQKHRYILDRFAATDDTLFDSFKAACESIDESHDSLSLLRDGLDRNDREALETWHNEACQQDDEILKRGYWIHT